MLHARDGGDAALEGLAVHQANVETTAGAEPGQQVNAVEQPGLRFGSEALQFSDLTGFTGFAQIGDGRDTKFLMHHADALRTQPRNVQHVQHAGWRVVVEVHPIRGPCTFAHRLFNARGQPLADAFDLHKAAGFHQFPEVVGQRTKRARPVLVGANSEDVGVGQFQKDTDLMERGGDLVPSEIGRSIRPWPGQAESSSRHVRTSGKGHENLATRSHTS